MFVHFIWQAGQGHDEIDDEIERLSMEPVRTSATWFHCPLGHWFPHWWYQFEAPLDFHINVFECGSGLPFKTPGGREMTDGLRPETWEMVDK